MALMSATRIASQGEGNRKQRTYSESGPLCVLLLTANRRMTMRSMSTHCAKRELWYLHIPVQRFIPLNRSTKDMWSKKRLPDNKGGVLQLFLSWREVGVQHF